MQCLSRCTGHCTRLSMLSMLVWRVHGHARVIVNHVVWGVSRRAEPYARGSFVPFSEYAVRQSGNKNSVSRESILL